MELRVIEGFIQAILGGFKALLYIILK